MHSTRRSHLVWLASAAAPAAALSQLRGLKREKKVDPTRTVKGQVTDEAEEGIRAIVRLKNTRTSDVKSFHTNEAGEYHFHGLDLNIDYELTALAEGKQSRTRTVTSFDNRTELIYNFKLKAGS